MLEFTEVRHDTIKNELEKRKEFYFHLKDVKGFENHNCEDPERTAFYRAPIIKFKCSSDQEQRDVICRLNTLFKDAFLIKQWRESSEPVIEAVTEEELTYEEYIGNKVLPITNITGFENYSAVGKSRESYFKFPGILIECFDYDFQFIAQSMQQMVSQVFVPT